MWPHRTWVYIHFSVKEINNKIIKPQRKLAKLGELCLWNLDKELVQFERIEIKKFFEQLLHDPPDGTIECVEAVDITGRHLPMICQFILNRIHIGNCVNAAFLINLNYRFNWWLPARGAPCTCSGIYLPDKTKCHLHSQAFLGTKWMETKEVSFLVCFEGDNAPVHPV